MPTDVTIKDCDTLSSIALANGKRDWHLVWDTCGLKGKHKNPHILFKADQIQTGFFKPKPVATKITLPDLPKVTPKSVTPPTVWKPGVKPGSASSSATGGTTEPPPPPPPPPETAKVGEDKPKEESGATEAKHTFVTPTRKLELRLRVMEPGTLKAIPESNYTLKVEKKPITGKTKPDGSLEAEIPPSCKEGELTLMIKPRDEAAAKARVKDLETQQKAIGNPKSEESKRLQAQINQLNKDIAEGRKVVFKLLIGKLNPVLEPAPDVDCVTGVQARLNNLQFLCGDVDGVAGPATKGAITRFQRHFGMKPEDGLPSAPLQTKLAAIHDTNKPIPPPIPPKPGGPAPSPPTPPPTPPPSGPPAPVTGADAAPPGIPTSPFGDDAPPGMIAPPLGG